MQSSSPKCRCGWAVELCWQSLIKEKCLEPRAETTQRESTADVGRKIVPSDRGIREKAVIKLGFGPVNTPIKRHNVTI